MNDERLVRTSHQQTYGDPESPWHSLLFLLPENRSQYGITSHYFFCEECHRWRMYNPRMATTLKHDYQGIWEYWKKREAKKQQKALIEKSDAERKAETMFANPAEERKIPYLWIEEGESYTIVVHRTSQLEETFVDSNHYSGWKLFILCADTVYGLPVKIVMSMKELNLLKAKLKGNWDREIVFERIRRDGMRRQVALNEAHRKKDVELDKALEGFESEG